MAERIVEMVPCAEMVAFGKNGSDAVTAAVRLARAVTERDVVLLPGADLIGSEVLADGIHPSDEGHARLAAVIGAEVIGAIHQ